MIALRGIVLGLALAGTAAGAQSIGSDVPPPRDLKPIAMAMGARVVPTFYRETPPIMQGSFDRFVPVVGNGCPAMAMDRYADRDDDDMRFADDGFYDDGYYGR